MTWLYFINRINAGEGRKKLKVTKWGRRSILCKDKLCQTDHKLVSLVSLVSNGDSRWLLRQVRSFCVLCWFSLNLADFGFNVCWPVSQKANQNTHLAWLIQVLIYIIYTVPFLTLKKIFQLKYSVIFFIFLHKNVSWCCHWLCIDYIDYATQCQG